MFLKDRFGASQLIEWENLEQGVITCFATAFFTFDLTIPIDDIVGDEITLTSSTISKTNFKELNLTDQVTGLRLEPGITLALSFDLTECRRYAGLTTITAGITDLDVECTGIDRFIFLADNTLSERFPSMAPTAAPTISLEPTVETPCLLSNVQRHDASQLIRGCGTHIQSNTHHDGNWNDE
jgi:hypothetical protein